MLGQQITKTVYLRVMIALMIGASYAIVLGLLGAALTGAGHGTEAFLAISFSPFTLAEPGETSVLLWIAFCYWPIVAVISSIRQAKALGRVLLVAHYLGIVVLFSFHFCSVAEFVRLVRIAPVAVALWAFVYIGGQVLFWWLLWGQRIPRVK